MSVMVDFEKEVREKVSEVLASIGATDVTFVVEESSVDGVDLSVP